MRHFKPLKKTFWVVFSLGVFLLLVKATIVRVTKNFYTVDKGKFYRSAQLTPVELQEVVEKYGIKTVISLRGEPEGSYWVKPQVALLEKAGVKFQPVNWSSDFLPEKHELAVFAETIKNGQYPMLVHCRSGADRTGEASAIYAIEFMKKSKEEAIAEQLSFKYWHIKWARPAKEALVRAWQGLDWAIKDYNPCEGETRQWASPGQCSDKK